jgi:hypothetical protein
MKHTITLVNTEHGWQSIHSDPEIRQLFGTDTLPCAATSTTPAADVLQEITRLNPDRVVVLMNPVF